MLLALYSVYAGYAGKNWKSPVLTAILGVILTTLFAVFQVMRMGHGIADIPLENWVEATAHSAATAFPACLAAWWIGRMIKRLRSVRA